MAVENPVDDETTHGSLKDEPTGGRRFFSGPWPKRGFDLLAVFVLLLIASDLRFRDARGDLWLDEADYALASVRGFQANRWDAVETGTPDRLLRLRHFHPPLGAHLVGLASRWNREDRTLRMPSVVAGSVTVALVYLCGLFLFCGRDGRSGDWAPRLIALACAVVLLPSPAHIRASSHALPWAFITLWLVAIALAMSAYAKTRSPSWLLALGGFLGMLFATSEYALVAAGAIAIALPILVCPELRDRERRRRALFGLVGASAFFLIAAETLWPAGLRGGAVKMLSHYVEMANDSWPVSVGDVTYDRAPKWAYLYWYRTIFPAQACWYALGAIGLAAVAAFRGLTMGVVSFLILTVVVLAAAHKSHIIGPEYLVHALPLLTLLGGLFFMALARFHAPAASVLALACAVGAALGPVRGTLSGMDQRSQLSRWPTAAKFLAETWKPTDMMLAPPYGGVGRWYLIYYAGVGGAEFRVQSLPDDDANDKIIREIEEGRYAYIAVGSTFSDWAGLDNRIRIILQRWPIIWVSNEHGAGPSRLTIYEYPKSTIRAHPMRVPIL